MKKLISILVFSLLSLCSTSAVKAAGVEPPQIFFVNGVWNDSIGGALDSAKKLELALEEEVRLNRDAYGLSGAKVGVRTIWNPGDGSARDVLEVFAAQRVAGISAIFSFLEGTKRFGELLAGSVPDPTAEERSNTSSRLVKNKLLLELKAGRAVVIVAHSQGNIVVDAAISAILEEHPEYAKCIGVVGVGVASTRKIGRHYRYITVNPDIVIGPLPNALPTNFIITNPAEDITYHQFVSTYLSPLGQGYFSDGEEAIVQTIRHHVANLVLKVFEEVTQECGCIAESKAFYDGNNPPQQSNISFALYEEPVPPYSNSFVYQVLNCEYLNKEGFSVKRVEVGQLFIGGYKSVYITEKSSSHLDDNSKIFNVDSLSVYIKRPDDTDFSIAKGQTVQDREVPYEVVFYRNARVTSSSGRENEKLGRDKYIHFSEFFEETSSSVPYINSCINYSETPSKVHVFRSNVNGGYSYVQNDFAGCATQSQVEAVNSNSWTSSILWQNNLDYPVISH